MSLTTRNSLTPRIWEVNVYLLATFDPVKILSDAEKREIFKNT